MRGRLSTARRVSSVAVIGALYGAFGVGFVLLIFGLRRGGTGPVPVTAGEAVALFIVAILVAAAVFKVSERPAHAALWAIVPTVLPALLVSDGMSVGLALAIGAATTAAVYLGSRLDERRERW